MKKRRVLAFFCIMMIFTLSLFLINQKSRIIVGKATDEKYEIVTESIELSIEEYEKSNDKIKIWYSIKNHDEIKEIEIDAAFTSLDNSWTTKTAQKIVSQAKSSKIYIIEIYVPNNKIEEGAITIEAREQQEGLKKLIASSTRKISHSQKSTLNRKEENKKAEIKILLIFIVFLIFSVIFLLLLKHSVKKVKAVHIPYHKRFIPIENIEKKSMHIISSRRSLL